MKQPCGAKLARFSSHSKPSIAANHRSDVVSMAIGVRHLSDLRAYFLRGRPQADIEMQQRSKDTPDLPFAILFGKSNIAPQGNGEKPH